MKISNLFKDINKQTGADTLQDSPFAKVTEFLSTNSLALNRICSGSIFNGIP